MIGFVCSSVLLAGLCGLLSWRLWRLRRGVEELRSRNRELSQARQEALRASEQSKRSSQPTGGYESRFLASISHELRTPLNSMLILSKLLLKNPEDRLAEEQLKWVRTIHSSGTDLLKLINDILDFSAIEAQSLSLRCEEVALALVRDRLEQVFRCVAMEKQLEFSADIEADTPPVLYTDPDRLQQILRNLLSNAFKFTETGWVRVRFYRPLEATGPDAAGPREGAVEISVSDSGIGIAAENQEAIFEAFRQEDAGTGRKYGGTGLGLSISRELAALLGGTIRIESRQGLGSTFTVRLPERMRQRAT